jgi:uncharacterized protein YjbJ (UPF0337 family)
LLYLFVAGNRPKRRISQMSAGTGDKIKGRMQKAAGELTNDQDLKDRGTINEASGKIKDGVERGVNRVKDALKPDHNRKP